MRARKLPARTPRHCSKTDAKPKPVKEFVPLKEVQIGQEVVIADLGQTATVTARPDRNNMVEVRAGIMKTKVPLSNLCTGQDGEAQARRTPPLHPRAAG